MKAFKERLNQWFVKWLKPKPKPTGPCYFCGEPTWQVNENIAENHPSRYRHLFCMMKDTDQRAKDLEFRKQVEFMKTAMREIEEEKSTSTN